LKSFSVTALSAHRLNRNAVSAEHCAECGEDIPSHAALPFPDARRARTARCYRIEEEAARCVMFALIQRGQIYADQHGWPVIIHSCTSQIVRYWRQGRINTASIDRFNNDFEHLDHREAAQIRAELETSEHIKSLRAQRAA
jgi:hypothetical protein